MKEKEKLPLQDPEQNSDGPSLAYALAGFFFPLVGMSLWLLFQGRYPKKAGSALKGAAIGGVLLLGIITLAIVSMLASPPKPPTNSGSMPVPIPSSASAVPGDSSQAHPTEPAPTGVILAPSR